MSTIRWNKKLPNYAVGKVLGYVNAAGDVEAITAPASGVGFPLWGTVYVDLDFATLAAQGWLAYGTLEDALVSWRAGGAAQIAYGTPAFDTNPGIIKMGAGVFESSASLNIDVDVTIMGEGRDATILRLVAGGINPWIVLTSTVAVFEHMTIDAQSGTNQVLAPPADSYNVFRNVRVIYDADFLCILSLQGGGFYGEFLDCVFDMSNGGANCNFTSLSGATSGTGKFYRCKFNFPGGAYYQNSRVTEWEHYDCQWSADTTYLFYQFNGTAWNGKFVNCQAINIGGKVASSAGSGSPFSPFIDDCQFTASDHVIENFGGILTGSYLLSTGTDKNAINAALDGAVVSDSRLIGTGTGLSVQGGAVTVEISGNRVRNPTGDVAGTYTDVATPIPAANGYNVELPAATTA